MKKQGVAGFKLAGQKKLYSDIERFGSTDIPLSPLQAGDATGG
jgi:hypothetical protein